MATAALLLVGDGAAASSALTRGTHVGKTPTRMPGGDGGVRMPTGPRYPGGHGPRMPRGPRGLGGIGVGGVILGVTPALGAIPTGPAPGRVIVTDQNDDPLPAHRRRTRQAASSKSKSGSKGGSPPAQTSRATFVPPPAGERRFVANEVILDIDARVPERTLAGIARQNRLTRLEAREFVLTGRKLFRWRIDDGRSVASVIRALGGRERRIAAAYPNYLYELTQATGGTAPSETEASLPLPTPDGAPAQMPPSQMPGPEATAPPTAPPQTAPPQSTASAGDPAQYTLAKLRVPEAHRMATGDKVLVAVIDSGIDSTHPDLAGVVSDVYDVLGGTPEPHAHGTGMAGAIASHGKLMGVAPRVQLLAIRAFGGTGGSAQGSTFNILKSLDWAHVRGARVVNMSFAGPSDPALKDALVAARKKGMILVAAAGNAGPKSAPLFPAADPNVIAVTATDAEDNVFAQANRGTYIAVAAPGVDVLVPAPANSYQLSSGTSVAAAHVSGVVALMMERNARIDPEGARKVLTETAKALGVNGRAPDVGAGLADAYQAIMTVAPSTEGQSNSVGPRR